MALDWNKDISFTGLRKRTGGAGKADYPSKTYMNLMVRDTKTLDIRRTVLVGILLALVVIAVAKFGVFDFYARINQKSLELVQKSEQLGKLEEQLVDYDEVLSEYNLYESARIVSEGSEVAAMDALELVDRIIKPSANVSSINFKSDVLTLGLSQVSLDAVGSLVGTLYEQPIVENVSVSTAANNQKGEGSNVAATMVISLRVPPLEKTGASAGSAQASGASDQSARASGQAASAGSAAASASASAASAGA